MIFKDGQGTLLIGGAGLALLSIFGARTVRRVSARDPSGQHWLLRTLALLSPACVIASLAVAVIGPTCCNSGTE